MAIAGIKVLTVGKTWPLPYEVRHLGDASEIVSTLARFQPDVIVTSTFMPTQLGMQPFNVRKKWIHVNPDSSPETVGQAIEACYSNSLWKEHSGQKANPLITVYTPTYNSGDYLKEAYRSLREQTYANWEWVVMDDCSSDGTWDRLNEMQREDIRVRPFRSAKRMGKVGAVKDAATRLATGVYLVELDHDDMLTETALDEIRKAFDSDSEVGFVYSNSSNFFENGTFQRFGDDFWKNRYRETEYRGKKWLECLNPDIYGRFGDHFSQQFAYFLTVGPNHVRAFRRETFQKLGGYNPNLIVADDWDLYARFFLYSKCHHVDKMLYLYRIKDNWANTTFTHNQAIQDHLALGRNHYASEFERKNKERLEGKKPKAKEETGVLLTVGICTMPSRMEGFAKVSRELSRQAEGKPVEIFCFMDNRKSNLSEKRNLVIAGAKGKYVSFVDDDDEVAPDYVDVILRELELDSELDCVVFDVLVHGYTPQPKVCKYGIEYQHKEGPEAYYRKPNHLMVFRTEIARRHQFRKELSAISEDTEWAERSWKDIGKQKRIDKVLYQYLYDASKTTQVNPAPQAAPATPQVMENPAPKPPVEKATGQVSFIVLEAVRDQKTVTCLSSIKKWAPGAEIVLVVNGSKPYAKARKLANRIVDLDANLGFAAGCTAGAAAATKPVLCFMNNDAAFVDETPKKLLSAMTEEYAIVGPYSNRAKPPQGDIPREQTPQRDQTPDMIVGLCMMLPAALYKKLGGFDPRLLTYEDDDFCLRARAEGKLCKVVGGTWVDHERHATFKALGLDVNRIMAENGQIYRKKNQNIRVIVIAKDEEKSLGGFFMQFAGVTRDWCVLDTGSNDRTVEISQALGAKVEKSGFKDFASARNEALDRFGKDADWIIMFDPDERLDTNTIDNLKELVFRTQHDIFLAPLDAVYPDGSKRQFVAKPFLFRNRPGIRWVFKVHEKLVGSQRQAIIANAKIEHVIVLHEDGRRQAAGGFYDQLMKAEPYFTDQAYKKEMIEEWPILDYDRMDDARLAKIHIGPLVSVVTPTYKRKDLLEKAVKSAIQQDYANLEIVIVGDSDPVLQGNCGHQMDYTGSVCPPCPDKPALCSQWLYGERIRKFNLKKNHGSGGAVPRNHAIIAAAGSLIAYLDDDNEWKPNHVSSVVKDLLASGSSFAFSSMEVDGKDLRFTEPKHQGIDTSCVIHQKELIDKYGPWKDRIEGGYSHDWEFISRWVKGAEKWAATKLPTLLYNAKTSGQADFLNSLSKAVS